MVFRKNQYSFVGLIIAVILFFIVFAIIFLLNVISDPFLYFLIIVLIVIIPSIGIIALKELPKEQKIISICKKIYYLTIACQATHLIIPLTIAFMLVFDRPGYCNSDSTFVLIVLCCIMIISITIANLSQSIMNVILFMKVRNRGLLYAIITQCIIYLIIIIRCCIFLKIADVG
jgi:hypothetical protein